MASSAGRSFQAPSTQMARHLVLGREVDGRAGQVGVGRGIGEQAADEGYDAAEVERVSPPAEAMRRLVDLEQDEATAGGEHARRFAQDGGDRNEVAQGEGAGHHRGASRTER